MDFNWSLTTVFFCLGILGYNYCDKNGPHPIINIKAFVLMSREKIEISISDSEEPGASYHQPSLRIVVLQNFQSIDFFCESG